MNKGILWLLLLVPLALSVFTVVFAARYRTIEPHLSFYSITILSFLLVSAIGLIAGFRTTANRNKSLFGGIALAVTLAKIFVAVLLAVVYVKLYPDISNWFILPFFLIYLYFTIYETFALIQIGRHPYS